MVLDPSPPPHRKLYPRESLKGVNKPLNTGPAITTINHPPTIQIIKITEETTQYRNSNHNHQLSSNHPDNKDTRGKPLNAGTATTTINHPTTIQIIKITEETTQCRNSNHNHQPSYNHPDNKDYRGNHSIQEQQSQPSTILQPSR